MSATLLDKTKQMIEATQGGEVCRGHGGVLRRRRRQ